ncbi:type II secretion system minor pseudopilin GspK [Endozoicomonas sp. SCSIO W0465]|uniref:type II secretion system minor pseudopilin GspK n=1 Tax=Endozoicomonas sp. SCSIO W0465 TaxID=2918516 RepID=UPI0020752DA3|nr:type II secretion system minor pseudopilin GspK [Endozoicomonas sp. SCSIO W0465]USE38810.1 type II secretion system minor pseudopilin GspK [Endozoicomonas sp. SCSIO W0465]
MAIESAKNCQSALAPTSKYLSCYQSGIALIYVLLIFLLITTVTSEIVMNLWLHTAKNARYLERTQAKHYALGAEQYVAWRLEKDFEQDKKNNRMVDHENELWNVETINYEVEQGVIELQVQDEQSRFNLNWLTDDNRPSGGKRVEQGSSPGTQMFENLLLAQSMDPQLAYKMARWMGKEQKNESQGAEDQVYLSLTPPRRTGQTEMTSVSELMLIDGFNNEEIEKLLPYITVIPRSSKMNMNTALPEVIRSLNKNISQGDALMISNSRGDTGLANIEELNQLVALSGKAGVFNEKNQNERVVFGSQYFSTRIKATYRETTFYLKTIFYRSREGHVQIVGREIGPSQYWVPVNEVDSTRNPGFK